MFLQGSEVQPCIAHYSLNDLHHSGTYFAGSVNAHHMPL